MFYYPNVLQRHSGCFSTVWLAATKGIRVSRRELLGVNVKTTCWEILDYVTAQVPAPQPNLPRPRFSLYLSSQLQYGVVVVYHRQCGFLLEEVQLTIARLLKYKKNIRIDMAESDRLALDVPQQMQMMEETEGAQDPFFGLMVDDDISQEYFLKPLRKLCRAVSHVIGSAFVNRTVFLTEEPSLVYSAADSTLHANDYRSPPAGITLTEKEQFVIAAAEYFVGDDLPEATAREIDLLLDQPDEFRGVEGGERTRGPRGTMSFVDQLKETMFGTEPDSVWLRHEGTGQPVEVSTTTVANLETTPKFISMPTPPSGTSGNEDGSGTNRSSDDAIVRPVGKSGGRRRRQLVFADPEVQISDRVMQEQIRNPRAGTLELSDLLLDVRLLTGHVPPSQLFNAPCGFLFHDDLMSLWKEQATPTFLPQHEAVEEAASKAESEQDREILRTERRKSRRSGMKEFSSGAGVPTADGLSDGTLEMFKEDRPLSDVVTPICRWSLQEDVQPMMEPIPEENIEMPEAHPDSESMDRITSVLQRIGKFTFDALLPPVASRLTAAHMLFELLDLLSAGQARVGQAKPYSSITIHPTAPASH